MVNDQALLFNTLPVANAKDKIKKNMHFTVDKVFLTRFLVQFTHQ